MKLDSFAIKTSIRTITKYCINKALQTSKWVCTFANDSDSPCNVPQFRVTHFYGNLSQKVGNPTRRAGGSFIIHPHLPVKGQ